jgi:adenylate cyclase
LSFGLVLGFIFNFLGIVNTLIGRKILGKLFIGKYRQPSEVEHAFMFLDIRSSTAIAEKTGPRRFMSLVNDFFHDIALPVAATKGEIYKYIGDGVIITWEMRDALMDANCLRCFAGIREIIQARKDHYLEKYGLVPEFGAGLHGGTVTTGELGYTRREIAFMGDVLNTTARIEEACKKHKAGLLVSEYLMEKLEVPKEMQVRSVGIEVLRGKTEEIKLSEVIPTDQSPAP